MPNDIETLATKTFKERMEADFAAMKANEPRPMPDNFGLDLHQDTRDGITVTIWTGQNGIGPLAFAHTEEVTANLERYEWALRQSAWLALELKRLGRTDELKSRGVLS